MSEILNAPNFGTKSDVFIISIEDFTPSVVELPASDDLRHSTDSFGAIHPVHYTSR
jgi:hypothetical protein